MTHVSERSGAGGSPSGAGGDRQPWTAGSGRPARKRAVSYADAGVSIEAGDRAVELLKSKVKQTRRPEVMGDLGGFAGLFRLDTTKYKHPILASSTDGVGTKLVIAQQMDIHDTVGIDLVAMVVDDLVACGAEPLFLLDYIATGEVVPDKVAEIAPASPTAAGTRAARCWVGRPPSTRVCCAPTSTTSPPPVSVWWRRARSSAPSGSRWATW